MMETLEKPRSRKWIYPRAEFAKMYAPLEKVDPAVKLRELLRARFALRKSDPDASWVHTAGAYDALTSALMTDLGFECVYASGWQLALTRHMCPDMGLYPSHEIVELVRELTRGVEAARDRHFYETHGELKGAPPVFADMEAGFGGPAQTFALARELARAGAAGVHLEDQDPAETAWGHAGGAARRPKTLVSSRKWIEKLVAVKAAAQAAERELVVIARTDAADGRLPDGREGGLEAAVERGLAAAELGVDVVWPEFGATDGELPARFAEAIHKEFPDQILGYNFSPSLHWGQAKREGRLLTNRQLAGLGYTLQFSSLLSFRTAGMALETWLKGYRQRGSDALADLQLIESASLDGEPRTRLQQQFSGAGRWLGLEQLARSMPDRD